ncbi:hypothetical protein A2303_07230 [Candidatus Falkowbacteria bacterium RIFOXYB2_FULL_47_14]|uniref:EF-hand domain-containing protein n=1 Tax=Candidatus Falkowbacteria bacterium RIFOXYA2_FULL_47_19 TaxID=1797994 RepID=A0A1F5SGB2_9BACT|nr:MAG: hypothetical protein A2227_00975 [Candidatus Falkowbacteria bacterium RIFOXYA2_FULL_47_19]OGF34940.1 MAG: hypothetical protein A2468_06935 [Candidatus Falkowbacteria bacterium RIFOXYC2_FULL_46_15]OGF43655.1 MAG: hypothetical protein A2303_07230 [Candidatus Falkowbacteria bacterium RIFOXYB2_FULL_47_14]
MEKLNIGKTHRLLFGALLIAGFCLVMPILPANAQDCSKAITIIARDTDGNFIPNANFSVYEQAVDVDGNPKPGKLVGSGKTDALLGKGTVIFQSPDAVNYALKINVVNKDFTSFYYYNEISLDCGQSAEITKVLSALKFTLRNTNGNLQKNRKFSLYTQRKDADSEPIKEKEDLVAVFDSSGEGMVKIYLPSDDQSVDGKTGGIFVFESGDDKSGIYTQYDIYASFEHTTNINYVYSDMRLVFRDSNNVFFPANTKINIYKQETGVNDEDKMGALVGTVITNDKGEAVFEYPAGRYMARITGTDKQYIYFLDLYIADQKRKTYELTTAEDQELGSGACAAASTFTLITKDNQNNLIPGLSYELYEQIEDANGKSAAGTKIKSGKIDSNGQATAVFNPDPRKLYALKIYDKNANVGDYWFMDEIRFICGRDKEVVKKLPVIHVILRNADGTLRKNQKFSVYTQKFDVDGNPVKEKKDLVSSALSTSEEGKAVVFVAPAHPHDKNKRGVYVLSVSGGGKVEYNEYNIIVPAYQDVYLDYYLSDIIVKLSSPAGSAIKNKAINFYEQIQTPSGGKSLGKSLGSAKTNNEGAAGFAYPAGKYAFVIADDLKQNIIFWDTEIKNRQRTGKTLTPNLTRIGAVGPDGAPLPANTTVSVYTLEADENNNYYKGKRLSTVKTTDKGYAEVIISPGPYLFTVTFNKTDYGSALYITNGELQSLTIRTVNEQVISAGQKFSPAKHVSAGGMAAKLKGRILLQVESKGEAWYVSPDNGKRFYMANGTTAYEIMRRFGLGISNENLAKIPIGLDRRFNEIDSDKDGVADKMEEALATNPEDPDSDGDGYDDYAEIMNGYNPKGSGQLPPDFGLSDRLKGRIILQVESKGEAWYVSPDDGRRYYMQNGASAYEIMRFLSLGITNDDLGKIEEGKLD